MTNLLTKFTASIFKHHGIIIIIILINGVIVEWCTSVLSRICTDDIDNTDVR